MSRTIKLTVSDEFALRLAQAAISNTRRKDDDERILFVSGLVEHFVRDMSGQYERWPTEGLDEEAVNRILDKITVKE